MRRFVPRVLHKLCIMVLALACVTVSSVACTTPTPTPPLVGPAFVEATVNADQGGKLVAGGLHIAFPAGALQTQTRVTATRVEDPPPLVTDAMVAQGENPADYRLVGQVYDIHIGDATLAAPVQIKMQVHPASIPAGYTLGDLKIVQYHEGEWFVLFTSFDPRSNELYAEADRFSFIGLALLGGLFVIGAASLSYIAGLKRSLTDPRYLQPELVDTRGFGIDVKNKRLTLNKPLRVQDRGSGVTPKYASEMQAEDTPTGMCIDFANLFGSLLIKEGYPVRVVAGKATYRSGTRQVSGGHLWVEVVIDGEPYYVDTYRANEVVALVPLKEAYTRFELDPGAVFWKELQDGRYVSRTQRKYDPDWWLPFAKKAPGTPSAVPTVSKAGSDVQSSGAGVLPSKCACSSSEGEVRLFYDPELAKGMGYVIQVDAWRQTGLDWCYRECLIRCGCDPNDPNLACSYNCIIGKKP